MFQFYHDIKENDVMLSNIISMGEMRTYMMPPPATLFHVKWIVLNSWYVCSERVGVEGYVCPALYMMKSFTAVLATLSFWKRE